MIRDIVIYGDPVLRKKCARVERVDDEVRALVEDMKETMVDAEGVGLAAPQVGVAVQLAVVDVSHDPECVSYLRVNGEDVPLESIMPLVFVNPQLELLGEKDVMSEGCLSFPEIRGDVTRPYEVKATLETLGGETLVVETDGLLARAIQHETDHLIVIAKDPETGEPTGLISEQALQLVERVIPQASAEEYAEPIAEIFDMFLSYGITSMQAAEGHRAPLDGLQFLESEGRLHQRVFVSWDWKTTLNLAYTVEEIESQIQNRSVYESERIRPNYVKIFSDGGPHSHSSELIEPYSDRPGSHGDANMTTEEFAEVFKMFDDWGVGVHVHSIGDGSIRRVIDALERMKEANGNSGVRHKVAHNMMITPEDLERVAALQDVNIDFSPPLWYPHAGELPRSSRRSGPSATTRRTR